MGLKGLHRYRQRWEGRGLLKEERERITCAMKKTAPRGRKKESSAKGDSYSARPGKHGGEIESD